MKSTQMISTSYRSKGLVSIIALLMLSGIVAFAQETRSAILGTVKDSSGAVVAGAIIEINNTETNTTAKVTTNESGYFEAPYLLPANYTITVSASGFKKYVQRGFILTVNSRVNMDISLEIGATTESVEVT